MRRRLRWPWRTRASRRSQSLGTIPHTPEAVARLMRKLGPAATLRVCYEAGPCGYGALLAVDGVGDRLHGGGADADPGPGRGSRQDRSAGCGETGPLSPPGRPHGGLGADAGARGVARPGPRAGVRETRPIAGAASAGQVPVAARASARRRRAGMERHSIWSGSGPSTSPTPPRTRRSGITCMRSSTRPIASAIWSDALDDGDRDGRAHAAGCDRRPASAAGRVAAHGGDSGGRSRARSTRFARHKQLMGYSGHGVPGGLERDTRPARGDHQDRQCARPPRGRRSRLVARYHPARLADPETPASGPRAGDHRDRVAGATAAASTAIGACWAAEGQTAGGHGRGARVAGLHLGDCGARRMRRRDRDLWIRARA